MRIEILEEIELWRGLANAARFISRWKDNIAGMAIVQKYAGPKIMQADSSAGAVPGRVGLFFNSLKAPF